MLDIVKLFIERLTEYFWQAIFLTGITLFILTKCFPMIFNFQLFENKAGIAQATLVFIVALSLWYILVNLINNVKISISNKFYEIKKNKAMISKQNMQIMEFIENLFNNQRPNPISDEHQNVNLLKIFILTLYNKKITKFQSYEIFNIYENEANEKQLHAEKGQFYFPILSKQKCIEFQNFLNELGLFYFDGIYYHINNKLFIKLDELKNRGMLEPDYLNQSNYGAF